MRQFFNLLMLLLACFAQNVFADEALDYINDQILMHAYQSGVYVLDKGEKP
jgi:hypothetical protein